MSALGKEWEIKLELLRSIVRSQEALARMLGSIADVTASSEPSAKSLKEHIRALTQLQGAIAEAVSGISWRPPTNGDPAPPWLSPDVLDVCAATEQ